MPEREALQSDDLAAGRGEVPGGGAAERAEPHDDVVDPLGGHRPCSIRGSSQRRMSALSSSIGANQPWV